MSNDTVDLERFYDTVMVALGDKLGFIPGISELVDDDTVYIEFDTNLTYDMLTVLSEEFGTRTINVWGKTEHTGGCDTCNLEYQVACVKILEITRWPGVSHESN
jgi:hypothetical protein